MDKEYVSFLENMVILLAGCYQETHDMLLAKMKEGNKAYLEMPTVQGTTFVFAVDTISKLKCKGTVNEDDMDKYVKHLQQNYLSSQ